MAIKTTANKMSQINEYKDVVCVITVIVIKTVIPITNKISKIPCFIRY